MIESLLIRNCALIEKAEINFGENLNILSGETGSGKSIIINSISFLLGQKISSDFIRTGEDFAEVTAAFFLKNSETAEILNDFGIEILEDNMLILNRNLNKNGKSVSRANGKIINIGTLKEISRLLIDIHGQHEHQALLNEDKHIALIDKFCEFDDLKQNLNLLYKQYREISKKIDELYNDDRDKERIIDMLTYQIKDIESANLLVDEEDELYSRKKILNSFEKISINTEELIQNLYSGDGKGPSAIDRIDNAYNNLRKLSEISEDKQDLFERLGSLKYELGDIITEIRDFSETLEYDTNELDRIEFRLDLIYRLKRKYGSTVAEILDFCKKSKEKLNTYTNSEAELSKLKKEQASILKDSIELCEKISKIRKNQAAAFKLEIQAILKELGMKDVRMEIEINRKELFDANGFDDIKFLISPNLGEPLKALSKIASGGEMSRIMLALKTILAKAYSIETFIFDEIDTGVSGRTAQKVAEKLNFVSKSHQILCITHLPQIAAMADDHFLIEKLTDNAKTFTNIQKLDTENSVKEIARLISGAAITEQSAKTAKEMIDQAKKYKL